MRLWLFCLLRICLCREKENDMIYLLSRGEFVEAALLVDSGKAESTEIEYGLRLYRDALGAIISSGIRETESRSIAPAFRWAQNDTTIFLEVKFAHTLSAPASTDASIDTVEIDGSRELRVFASAPQRGKRWTLFLRFWGEIDQVPRATETSAGRSSICLAKASSSAFSWPRLIECDASMPSNSALWLDMQESVGFSDDEDEDEDCRNLEDTITAALAHRIESNQYAVDKEKNEDTAQSLEEKATSTTNQQNHGSDVSKLKEAEKAMLSQIEDKEDILVDGSKSFTTAKNKIVRKKTNVKQLKKQATAAKRNANSDFKRKKSAVESETFEASNTIQQSLLTRHDFLMLNTPQRAPCMPKRLIVHDGAWDLLIYITDTVRDASDHISNLQEKIKYTLAIATANSVLAISMIFSGVLDFPRRLFFRFIFCTFLFLNLSLIFISLFILGASAYI